MRKTFVASLLVGALSLGLGYAVAQTIAKPKVPKVNAIADLLQVLPGGLSAAGNVYGTVAQVTAVSGYHDLGTVTTDPAYTAKTGEWNIFGHATGTVTAVTITTPASPGDGQRLCYINDQTTTTLTFTANTGQTVTSGATAGVANVPACITYNATTTVWKISN